MSKKRGSLGKALLLLGLWNRLPEDGQTWPEDRRKAWFGILNQGMEVLYPRPEPGGNHQ